MRSIKLWHLFPFPTTLYKMKQFQEFKYYFQAGLSGVPILQRIRQSPNIKLGHG